MAAKFFTGLPLSGPDPECVQGYGEAALAGDRIVPAASQDHSRSVPATRDPVFVPLGVAPTSAPMHACAENPLAGFQPDAV